MHYKNLKMMFVGLFIIIYGANTFAVPITILNSRNEVRTNDDGILPQNIVVQQFLGINIPTTETIFVSSGLSSSSTTINYGGDDESAFFSWDFSQSFDNTLGGVHGFCCDNASTYSQVEFTAEEDLFYTTTGYSDLVNLVGTDINFQVSQVGHNSGGGVDPATFWENKASNATENESFTLGTGTGGDVLNQNFGSLTGQLLAGHTYTFRTYFGIFDPASAPYVSASAVGNVTIAFSTIPTAVPESNSLALLIFGLLGLCVIRRTQSN